MAEPQERRHFDWDGCINARDLGGLPTIDGRLTRYGVFLRADTVCGLTAGGRQQLQADGVRTVIDLRNFHETEKDPNPFVAAAGITYLHRPFNDDAIEARMRELGSPAEKYAAMIDAGGARAVAIIDVLTTASKPVLFHCLGGRDRTGLVAALALALAGVTDAVIEDDYLLSDERLATRAAKLRAAMPAGDAEYFDRRLREAPDSIRSALRRLREGWGDADRYLRAYGLAEGRAAELKALFIE